MGTLFPTHPAVGERSLRLAEYNEPPTKRIDRFTDAELLGELHNRGRIAELTSTRSVSGFDVERHRHYDGFIRDVFSSMYREIASRIHGEHRSLARADTHREDRGYASKYVYTTSLWVITRVNPKGTRNNELQ